MPMGRCPMGGKDNKREVTLHCLLGLLMVLLGCIVAFLFIPRPLNTSEQSLVGSWAATEQDKVMTFNPDRTVDVTNTGVSRDVVFRWKFEGSRLAIKEGRGAWEYHNVQIDDGSFSILQDGEAVLQMVRQPRPSVD